MTEKELLERFVKLYNLSEKETEWGVVVEILGEEPEPEPDPNDPMAALLAEFMKSEGLAKPKKPRKILYAPGIYIHDSNCLIHLRDRRIYSIISIMEITRKVYPAEWQMVDSKSRLVAKENPEIFTETSVEELWDIHKLSLYGPWMEEVELPE